VIATVAKAIKVVVAAVELVKALGISSKKPGELAGGPRISLA